MGDSEYFRDINRRFQAMFHFFIDGASFIDQDPGWHYFICYMDNKVVGFTSVLSNKKKASTVWGNADTSTSSSQQRVLLSQFVVLPPYQGLGIGSTLLKIVYDNYLNDKNCVEFSVEEPSDEFQSLMDLIEVKLIWSNGFFTSLKKIFKSKKTSN